MNGSNVGAATDAPGRFPTVTDGGDSRWMDRAAMAMQMPMALQAGTAFSGAVGGSMNAAVKSSDDTVTLASI